MTIIEAALEKTKALRQRQATTGQQPSPAAAASAAQARRPVEPVVPPSTRIEARQVQFDPHAARENRLLLDASRPEDRSTVAAYGMLRTRILHRARSKGWQSIGITSAAPRDGKSLTAVNLALSLAREKNNMVVLLDLDMHNPSVCRTLGITPWRELREYFEDRMDSPSELFMSIGVENLIVAGNVSPTENSAALLASNRFEELLSFIHSATTNPFILIDLPPVLSPEDTLVVAPRVDALVLVASEEVTSRADLQKASELLADFQLAGVVLNRSSDASQRYGYGYGYGDSRPPASLQPGT